MKENDDIYVIYSGKVIKAKASGVTESFFHITYNGEYPQKNALPIGIIDKEGVFTSYKNAAKAMEPDLQQLIDIMAARDREREENLKLLYPKIREMLTVELMDGVKDKKDHLVVSSKLLASSPSWNPDYYNNEDQVKAIMKKIEGKSIEKMLAIFYNIIEHKSLRTSDKDILRINPKVLEAVTKVHAMLKGAQK